MSMLKIHALCAVASVALVAGAAHATTVTFSLGQTSQDYVLYGQGAYAPGLGTFTNQQGSETYDAGTNITTETLSGIITGSTDSTYGSGTYSFITTFTGLPIASGGTEIDSYSNAINSNQFNYSFLDPSVDMTLYLSGTPGGNLIVPVVTNGAFDGPGFNFTYVTTTCTGVAVCGQNNVGLTPGASQFGPVVISVTADSVAAVPELSTWSLMIAGFGMIGFAARARRRSVHVTHA